MSSTTDNVRPSPLPNDWRIDRVTLAAIALGACDLLFCSGLLAVGFDVMHLGIEALRTFAAVTLVFSAQALLYVVRERRRLWSSRPSRWFVASSVVDVGFISLLATNGILMAPLAPAVIGALAAASAVFALLLDAVKALVFGQLGLTEPLSGR